MGCRSWAWAWAWGWQVCSSAFSHTLSSPSGAIGLAPPQWLPFQQPSPNPGTCPTFPQQIRESRRTGRILWSLVLVVPGKAAFSRSLELALVAETNS